MDNIVFMPGEFLSTLSLRRATSERVPLAESTAISIHALLAESDRFYPLKTFIILSFLSTLSLRRATTVPGGGHINKAFLSTLSLRRATADSSAADSSAADISIHALLAESDSMLTSLFCGCCDFYPRSPCGERQCLVRGQRPSWGISIHALLAESDVHFDNYNLHCVEISIHALLAESDEGDDQHQANLQNFYPRSPCGERRPSFCGLPIKAGISIHALLAESDPRGQLPTPEPPNFYPRSPCGERR